jgi:hypothetical protein
MKSEHAMFAAMRRSYSIEKHGRKENRKRARGTTRAGQAKTLPLFLPHTKSTLSIGDLITDYHEW